MAITARTVATTEVASGSADITVTKPTGLADNDFVIVQIACNGGGATISAAPTGFTVQTIGSESNPRFFLAYKYITSAAGEGAWTFTQSSGTVAKAAIAQAWSGVDSSTPLATAINTATGATGSNNMEVSGFETPVNGCLAVYGCAVNSSTSAITPPLGMTEVSETAAQKKTEMATEVINIATLIMQRAGVAASSTLAWSAYLVALRPADPYTRLYLANDNTAVYSGTTSKGAWDKTSGAFGPFRLAASRTGIGDGDIRNTENVATADYDVLLGTWVSDPIRSATTIDGTIYGVLLATESATDANLVLHLHVWVTQGDSDSVRGTLLSDYIDGAEWAQSSSATAYSAVTIPAQTLTSVAAQSGDRIVVEVGFQAQNTLTTNYTGSVLAGGGSGGDAVGTESAISVTAGPHAWIDITSSFDFASTYLYTTSTVTGATIAATRGTWDLSTITNDFILGRVRSGSAGSRSVAETSTTNPTDALIYRLVSDELAAQTITANQVDLLLKVIESAADADAFQKVHLYVMAPDGSVRGTLLSNEVNATELGTNNIVRHTATLSSVVAQAGDRLVLEVGARFTNTTATSKSATFTVGDTSYDAGISSIGSSAGFGSGHSGWIRFSQRLVWSFEAEAYTYETPDLPILIGTPAPEYTHTPAAVTYETPQLDITVGTPAPTWSSASTWATPSLGITVGTPAPTYLHAQTYVTPALGLTIGTPAPTYDYLATPQGYMTGEAVVAHRITGTIGIADRMTAEAVLANRITGTEKAV